MRAALFVLAALLSTGAAAQADYPSKPITIVVPYPPGGTTDILPRLIQVELSKSLGVPIVIDNRAGAGGGIGTAYAARTKSDGYTIVVTNNQTMAINQWIYKKLQYDAAKDFAQIIVAAKSPNVLVVHPDVPAKNLSELIALAKAKPGVLTYASSGAGSTSHLCGSLLSTLADIKLEHIPYKGPGPAHQDLDAGRVTMMCDAISNVTQDIETGRIRGIVVAGPERHPATPNVPSAVEAKLPGFEMSFFIGFAAPAGTPAPIVNRLNQEVAKAIRNPDITKRLQGLGLTLVADSPGDATALVVKESAKYRGVVQASGAVVD